MARHGAPGRTFQLSVLAVLGFGVPCVAFIYIEDVKAQQLLATSAVVSMLGFLATKWLIPKVSPGFISYALAQLLQAMIAEAGGADERTCSILTILNLTR